MIRIYLYLLAGIISALIGWSISQFFLTDILANLGISLPFRDEIIIFPCIAISLAVGMVMNEIFISNPTRLKLNFRIAKIPLFIAIALGLAGGLIAGGVAEIFHLVKFSENIANVSGWLLIGISVGLVEGLTWQFYSLEAGDRQRYNQRFCISILGATLASLVAALLFEFIRSDSIRNIEDPLGFSLLGLLLGLFFSLTNSPSYMAALRAGKGFEYTGPIYADIDPRVTVKTLPYPAIKKTKTFKFVSQSEEDSKIEEGLSIQLPPTGKIKIGSADKADICIPGLPLHAADIVVTKRDAVLDPNPKFYDTIEVNGKRLSTSHDIPLKHNYLLTFYPLDKNQADDAKIYRFVYYNRFLDPQA